MKNHRMATKNPNPDPECENLAEYFTSRDYKKLRELAQHIQAAAETFLRNEELQVPTWLSPSKKAKSK